MSSQTRLEARGSLSVLKNKESLSVLANIVEVRWFSGLVVGLQIATWEFFPPLSLSTQVYKWVPAKYFCGYPCDGIASHPGEGAETPPVASCYGN